MDGTDGQKMDPIKKLDPATPDLARQNAERIAELVPEVVTEGPDGEGPHIDFDLLRQALSDHLVEGPTERYRLDWPGKRQAMLLANTPTTKTLRPVREDSVDFDTTRNLFIEGDNLEALKILQETYLGKVKMIYIDPPYNTGKDFIYRDDFRRSAGEELEASGQADEEGRLVANTEANGRFHSDWLSMMAPRLKLARSLLRDDGVIFVSIDEGEHSRMRGMLDTIFGQENAVSDLVWAGGRKTIPG
ncbi:site-specific DNA-methyltransferase [uncultured Jannaschia sp.]|uniref:site-specific DNA-methyltransferase n=1 Tax=uncultured Jannaschia sp. TaxID=293347 RepID=UPI002612D7DD|nr:site-specific DNA-methyltransferase [uncultured Jannaschia sp.]